MKSSARLKYTEMKPTIALAVRQRQNDGRGLFRGRKQWGRKAAWLICQRQRSRRRRFFRSSRRRRPKLNSARGKIVEDRGQEELCHDRTTPIRQAAKDVAPHANRSRRDQGDKLTATSRSNFNESYRRKPGPKRRGFISGVIFRLAPLPTTSAGLSPAFAGTTRV